MCVCVCVRNASTQTLQKLHNLAKDPVLKLDENYSGVSHTGHTSTTLDLLLSFQRLLVCKLYPIEQQHRKHCGIVSDPGESQTASSWVVFILEMIDVGHVSPATQCSMFFAQRNIT